jgi:hypothetical protein
MTMRVVPEGLARDWKTIRAALDHIESRLGLIAVRPAHGRLVIIAEPLTQPWEAGYYDMDSGDWIATPVIPADAGRSGIEL